MILFAFEKRARIIADVGETDSFDSSNRLRLAVVVKALFDWAVGGHSQVLLQATVHLQVVTTLALAAATSPACVALSSSVTSLEHQVFQSQT